MSSETTPSESAGNTTVVVAPTPTATPAKPRPKQPVPWSVILLDDDDHTYDYVMHMVQRLFGHTVEGAYQIAKAVDSQGRAVCMTTHKELAELKRDQILAFGADPQLSRSAGSMSAVIEPVAGSGEDTPSNPADNGRRSS